MTSYREGGPGHVSGSETSEAAAESVEPSASTMRARIYGEIVRRERYDPPGLTCDEVELVTGLSHQTASARCVELKRRGLLVPVGKRPTRSARMAEILRPAEFVAS